VDERAAGGRIIAQLWHTGAISHPEILNGAQPVSASNVDPGQISVTPTGRKPTITPRPLTKQEIQVTVADFGRAARNAMEAGFDGVQILANYLYLISQFLNATTNLRKDEYGGSLENRSRFLFEVVESVLGGSKHKGLESRSVRCTKAPHFKPTRKLYPSPNTQFGG
jgi:N-ethylmaleimide reductase